MSKSVGKNKTVAVILDFGGRTRKEWEKIELVQKMQDYLRENACPEDFDIRRQYQGEENFFAAISAAFQALEHYEPKPYGYEFDDRLSPKRNFGDGCKTGARLVVPVRKLK